MSSGDTSVSEQAQITTTFIEDSATSGTSLARHTPDDNLPIYGQTIPEFLTKPLLVASGLWATTDTAGTLLVNTTIATQLFNNAHWMNKLQGFSLCRGTAVYRLQINANPFQAGKLMLHFLPSTYAREVTYVGMHNHTLTERTQQPRVELDCRETAAIIHLPYITPANFCSYIATGPTWEYDWGYIYLSVLSPLVVGSGGTTTVEYSLYLSFEDFELAGPIVPQMSGGGPKKKYKTKSIGDKEEEATSGTPVANALGSVATISAALSAVPFLAPVAGPVSWVAAGLSGLASWFGWSKPRYTKIPSVIARRFNYYMSNFNGEDMLPTIALDCQNKLQIKDSLSVYDLDEMSWAFLKNQSALVKTFTWAYNQTTGTSLFTMQVNPNTSFNQTTNVINSVTATIVHGPPITYLAPFFKHWRGGIDYIFKIVKTDFHSGRLEITFTPGTDTTPTYPTTTTSLLALRHIIDIREGTEFCLTMPFLVSTNYLNMDEISGMLQVRVLNELRAPETCAQTISILVYIKGSPDLELQTPCNISNMYLPYTPVTQMEELTCDGIGGSPPHALNLHYASESIGESFSSIKQLLNRFTQVLWTTRPAASTNNTMINIWPYFSGVAWQHAATGATTVSVNGGDAYGWMSNMYAFYRGGAKIMVRTEQLAAGGYQISVCQRTFPLNATTAPILAGINTYTGSWSGTYQNVAGPGLVGFNYMEQGSGLVGSAIPYQAKTRCSNTLNISATNVIPTDPTQSVNGVQVGGYGALAEYIVYRSFGDDFQFAYFVGAPPVLTTNV